MAGTKKENSAQGSAQDASPVKNGFFDRYGPYLVLGGLIIYVILLAIGTIAEIFNIQSILDWWIWSPPGK